MPTSAVLTQPGRTTPAPPARREGTRRAAGRPPRSRPFSLKHRPLQWTPPPSEACMWSPPRRTGRGSPRAGHRESPSAAWPPPPRSLREEMSQPQHGLTGAVRARKPVLAAVDREVNTTVGDYDIDLVLRSTASASTSTAAPLGWGRASPYRVTAPRRRALTAARPRPGRTARRRDSRCSGWICTGPG